MKSQAGKVKVAAKTVAKPKAKPTAKTKPVVKAVAKAVVKAPVKPPAKKAAAAKTPTKVAAAGGKAASKAKPVLKAAPAKTVKPKAKVEAKAKARVEVKAKAKVEVKVKAKDSVKLMNVKAAKPPVALPKPGVEPVATTARTVLTAAPPPANPSVPARAGRPSSRLAQLTVPSMAQSVASTAAKASFSQTMSSPLIVPPLASAIKKDPKLANNWKTKPVEQLSDAELVAMPDDEYMNETQMAFFRRKLIQLKKDILSNAGETTEHLREDTVVVPDPADRATIEEEHALELRTRDRERKLLKKIEQSIARIDAGDYGYCDETGEPIGVGRLLARPTANLSLEAQQRRELKQKMFGD